MDNNNNNNYNNNINNENNNQSYGDYVNSLYNAPEDENKSNITKLILSIVNAVVVAPFILEFAVIWLIFGAFSGNPVTYYGILIGCLLYFIFTVAFLFRSIWKCIKSQKGKIIFIIVVLLLLGRFAITYNHVRDDIDKRRGNDVTQSETIKEDISKNSIPTEEFMIDNNKVIDRIMTLGYSKVTDNCSPNNDCYTDGRYLVTYMKTINRINVQKDTKVSKMSEYDCSVDMVVLNNMYNNRDLLSIGDTLNNIIRKMELGIFSDFVIELKGMRIRIYLTYDNKITYEITPHETKTIFNPNSLRATILKENRKENIQLKEHLYNVAIENNKNNFKMNDYIYSHYKTDENNFRKVIIQEGHYSLDVDNSGTGGNYVFNYYNYKDETKLTVEVEGNYFDKSYRSFIENDITYFNEKLGMRHEYNENLDNTLKTFIDNKEKNLEVDVDNTLSIKIRRADFATSLRYFTITYIFK